MWIVTDALRLGCYNVSQNVLHTHLSLLGPLSSACNSDEFPV